MTGTRIRWEDDGNGGFKGYVAALPAAFIIWQSPCDTGEYVLVERVATTASPMRFIHGKEPDELKACAGQLLEKFISSLGATWPEAYAARSENEGGTAVNVQPGGDDVTGPAGAIPERVNSYDRDTPAPAIGSRWLWEWNSPRASAVVTVTEVTWNGEEWWVECTSSAEPGKRHWNDLSRFWEAVSPFTAREAGQ